MSGFVGLTLGDVLTDWSAVNASIGPDPGPNTDIFGNPMDVSAPTPSWIQSLITGAVQTGEKIGLQQTVPAGTYVRRADGSIQYQQPTQGPAASAAFSLPGAFTTPGGSSLLWLGLIGVGGFILVSALGKH